MANQKHIDKKFVRRINEIIEANLSNERFGVSELAHAMNMSRSNLHRKVKATYGTPVGLLIRQVRLDRAMELLKESHTGVAEVAYQVGFGSPNYFSKCFQEKYGFLPSEIKAQLEDKISTDPESVTSQDETTTRGKTPLNWIIAGIVFTLLAAVIIIFIKPFSGPGRSGNMSIMVLPFHNDSPGEGDDYIINGLMEEILSNLALIEELDVKSRTTSEKYRGSGKSSREIAREVRVKYILEGSAQTVFDTTRISLQLIEALHDKHLWAKPYQREITLDNLFDAREEVSRAVAEELKIVLKLREENLIEKNPTENLSAYEAYLQANDLLLAAQQLTRNKNRSKVTDARRLLEGAINLDSSFADAYLSLGSIYINHLFNRGATSNVEWFYSNLEKGHALVEKALQFDPGNRDALRLKGSYYQRIGNHQKAKKYIDASFRNRPRSFGDYEWETLSYLEYDNYYLGIKSYLKYIELKPPEMDAPADLIHLVFFAFLETGFFELAQQHAEQHLDMTQDFDRYYYQMSALERWQGNHRAAQEYSYKSRELDTTITNILWWCVSNYVYLQEFDSAYKYLRLLEADSEQKGQNLSPNVFYGWVYLERGQKREADYHLQGEISKRQKNLEMKTPFAQKGHTHLMLGITHALLGDGPNTLKHLDYLKEVSAANIGWIYDLEYLSCFDFVRNTPEFKSVLKHMEKAYRKEHKRIDRQLRKEDYPTS